MRKFYFAGGSWEEIPEHVISVVMSLLPMNCRGPAMLTCKYVSLNHVENIHNELLTLIIPGHGTTAHATQVFGAT